MIDDMVLAGLCAGTQRIYQKAVRRLAQFYNRSPELLSEAEVAAYLLDLVKQNVARGTFATARAGIRFLFGNTLSRDWALLKKRFVCLRRSVCPWS